MALTEAKGGVDELLRLADALNVELESRNGRAERSGRGQFATPSQAARTMASLVEPGGGVLRVVDPGAGAGALMLALVAAAVERGGLELKEIFSACTAGLIFVSCFPDQATMKTYLTDISWGTEVWTPDHPTHLVHLDGERFLGPNGV